MPFATAPATLTAPPLTGGAVTCTAPAWTNALTTTSVFEHRDDGKVVQSGPANSYAPTVADVGHQLTCRSVAQAPGGSASEPAETTLSIVAAQLSLRAGKTSVALSYAGAGDLALHLSMTDSRKHEVWKHDAGAARTVKLPTPKAGLYTLCVSAPAAGQFAATQKCQKWRAVAKPKQRKRHG
jgi:hypothetical protein